MEASKAYLDMAFVERMSSEARAALRHEVDATTDKEQESLKRNNPEIYDSWMALVWELLDWENQHPANATICSTSADEHNHAHDKITTPDQPCEVQVTRKGDARDTLYDIEYRGRPISALFDAVHVSDTDHDSQTPNDQEAATRSERRARVNVKQKHRPESHYRHPTLYRRVYRDGTPNEKYREGRWSGFEAPSPEPSPKHNPMHSSPDISPTTAENINVSRQYWIDRGVFFDDNDNLIEKVKPFTANETFLAFVRSKDQDDIVTTASRGASRIPEPTMGSQENPTFLAFIDSQRDPGTKIDYEESGLPKQSAPKSVPQTARISTRLGAVQPPVKPAHPFTNPLDFLRDPYEPSRTLRRENRRLHPR